VCWSYDGGDGGQAIETVGASLQLRAVGHVNTPDERALAFAFSEQGMLNPHYIVGQAKFN